jgi:hypothetical protein
MGHGTWSESQRPSIHPGRFTSDLRETRANNTNHRPLGMPLVCVLRACAPNMHVYRSVCVLAPPICMFIEACASCVPRFPTQGHASWRCASCGLALPMCRFVEACVSCGQHAGMRPSGLLAPCKLYLEMGLVVCRPASSITLFTPPSAQSLPHTSARGRRQWRAPPAARAGRGPVRCSCRNAPGPPPR